MLHQLDRMSTAAYVNVVLFIQSMRQDLWNLKNDERGLSGVVVAVLLILVAVLAIVLLWGNLKTWLTDTWTNITGKANSIS